MIETLEKQPVESFNIKMKEFHHRISPAQSVLILTHDYPDPDCIASAMGMSHLCSFWGIPSRVISFGGFVGRAENRAMIRFLNIEMVPFVLIDVKEFDKIIMVDSFPGKGNVSLSASSSVSAVIDHHPSQLPENATCFYDIRQELGATSTIITKYLLEAGCPVPPKLATALFYGIKTDTGDMRRDVSKYDIECYKYLFDNIDHHLLSQIENPERDIEFFRLIHRAADSAINYDSVCYIHLGTVSTPDYIAEMADLFHSLEKIEWMICSGIFKNQIFFSIRTKNFHNAGAQAEKCGKMLGGSGGGHGRAAAGRIQIQPGETTETKLQTFESTFKELFDIVQIQPKKLL
jgi:nanoRNase/pAp phosphatase (c-di-AMP/oligoRNAs hydrolase)